MPSVPRTKYLPPARDVIAKSGRGSIKDGITIVAGWAARNPTRVRRWMYPKHREGGTGGLIPMEVIPRIIKGASRAGIALDHADFFRR